MTVQKQLIVGVDEAGRGPLAGPVVAAAVILDPNQPIVGLMDSKQLSEKKREILFDEIIAKAFSYGIGWASAEEIDEINILQATFLAMRRATQQLKVIPTLALVDGNQDPRLECPTQTIVRGDSLVPAISAASILAKVTRDRWMQELEQQYPGYGFAQHKGYPTRAHKAAIQRLGLTVFHRKSFRSSIVEK
ncbi:MAG: ribonuclease HII [Gammaproteobacteria bacterium]|nr:ribonuclease HII [Gammaproteobacteria bacterium]